MSGEKTASLNPGAYPALRIVLIYACGILLGKMFSPDTSLLYLYAAFAVIFFLYGFISLTSLYIKRYRLFISLQLLPSLYFICIAGYGFLNISAHQQPVRADEQILRLFDSGELTYYGGVIADRQTRSGNRLLSIKIDSVRINGFPTWYLPFKTEAMVPSADDAALNKDTTSSNDAVFSTDMDLSSGMASSRYEVTNKYPGKGDYIHFQGELRIPQRPGNPNQFDYAAYLSRRNIHTQIYVSEVEARYSDKYAPFWIRQQVHILASLTSLFSDSNQALASAIILGDRSRLDPQLRTEFSRAGLAHLMAVSGMHVGFVLLPVWFMLPWCRSSAGKRFSALTFGGLLLLGYAGITGFAVSVSRAALMSFFLMIARLYHKPGTSMNILGAAALILLLLDPLMLFDIGFQLSFLAVIIILVTLPGTRYLLPARHRYTKTGALFQFVMVSVLVQGGLYPLLIHYFNEFSIAGPLSNTLAVPFIQLMFLWSFFCLIVSFVHPTLSVLLNLPGDYILTALTRYVQWIGTQPFAWVEGTLPDDLLYGIWFFAISTLASLRIPALRWKMFCGCLLFITLFQCGKVLHQMNAPEFKITFYDVGQGDAVLLQTPGGYNYLYDTGVWTPGYNSGERTLVPELRASGIKKLDGIFLSHPHADHIGGMESLIEKIPVDTIYQTPYGYNSRLYSRYMQLASGKKIPVKLLTTGQQIQTDVSLPILVLAPSDAIPASDPNNRSLVLLIGYGETRLLLTGDAEIEAETFLVNKFGDFLKADLLKIGHHGSRTSSNRLFLERVSASYGVASLAKRNHHNHPHPEATRRLHNARVSVRYTSLEGAIIFNSDGRYYTNVPWRRDNFCPL